LRVALVTLIMLTVERAEHVELIMSSVSICAVRRARHSQSAWACHVECVVSCRDVTIQVEFELN